MNYIPNIASGNTDKINAETIRCSLSSIKDKSVSDNCCVNKTPPGPLTVQSHSMYLKSKNCPNPTPAEFALYPKVAVPSSVRTMEKLNNYQNCTTLTTDQRFAKYKRWQPPIPCQPLPQTAQSAGISKPGTRACNLQTFY